MRKFFLSFTLLLIAVFSIGQSKSRVIVPENYCFSEQRPILFTIGDTVIVACDSIYLMNAKRYAFYKSIHEALLLDDDTVYSKLLLSYELRLKEHHDTFERLFKNIDQADITTQNLIDYSQGSLTNTHQNVYDLQEKLDISIKNLELANGIIKDERRKNRNSKALIGIGGTSLGILIGVLIMK